MRSKSIGIETITVMLLLVLFAFVVFIVIDAGSNAFEDITTDKQSTMSARVSYSYISMKVKQNDTAGAISVEQTPFGDTLRIDNGDYSTYIFYSEGALYECVTKKNGSPSVGAANKISSLNGFTVSMKDHALFIECIFERGDGPPDKVNGTVGIRS